MDAEDGFEDSEGCRVNGLLLKRTITAEEARCDLELAAKAMRSVFNGRILISYHQNPDFLLRNVDFLLRNVDFIIKQG